MKILKRKIQELTKKVYQFQALPYEYLRLQPRYKEMIVKLAGQNFKIADPMSFYWSYREIFGTHIYKFHSKKTSPTIIDCGSNYGTSLVYFKTIYPEAKIIAVEADPKIYEILEWNVHRRNFNNIRLINKAVSTSPEPIKFYREGADGGRSYPLSTNEEIINIETIQLDDLIQEPIDFLKMDIEGAETEVICTSKKLQMANQIFIEYHSFKDAAQSLNQILDVLSSNGFRYYIHTQFCSPSPLTEEKLQLGMDMQLNIFAKKSE